MICLTAFALSPPRLFTTGVLASRWYWLKDQFLGFEEDELKSWLVLETAESRRRGFRRWWERKAKVAPLRPRAAVEQVRRGRWRRRDILGG